VAADVAAVHPTLTVVTGDLTMRARSGQFSQARDLLDRLPAPMLVVPGNHDVPLFDVERLFAPYRRYQRFVQAELDPVCRMPGLTVLGLHTTPRWRWKSGRVSRGQSEAIVAVLGSASAGAVRVLAMHHPPRAAGLARLVGRRRLLQAVGSARVDLILAGHTHVPRASQVDLGATAHRPVEVVAGTAVSLRTRGTVRSWTVIRVDSAAIAVEERLQSATGWRTGGVQRFTRRG
jgi:3',5'-cyclic AMP phosphodiesterase CpdA